MSTRRIYADHAATTPLSEAAWTAMAPFLREEFGNPSSIHSWARKPREALSAARVTIGECIGAEPDEIFFTSGGTESDNWVIKGTEGGLMVSAYEHHAVLNAAKSEMMRGRPVCYCKPKMEGSVCPDQITAAWQVGVKLVSIMAANNEIGSRNVLAHLADHIHSKGALFHTDAVQAVGHVPINVKDDGIDFLSASGHKFNGPRGIGFLFMRKGLALRPLMNGGQQELGLRAGTENVAAIVGMAAALKENCDNIERNAAHLDELKAQLLEGIARLSKDAYFPGSKYDFQLPGFVCVSFPGRSAEGIVHVLDLKGVAISAGAACDSKNTQISHVLKSIHLPREFAEGTIRITLGIENSKEDVQAILDALRIAVREGRSAASGSDGRGAASVSDGQCVGRRTVC